MTTITEPGSPVVQAAIIRAHLRLQRAGMKHSKMSRKDILAHASHLTGVNYRNSPDGCSVAISDLTVICTGSAAP